MRQVVQADEHDTRCGSGAGTDQQAGAYIERPMTGSWTCIKSSTPSIRDISFIRPQPRSC
ncbi:hypothetical protein SAMN05421665_0504 [Yoonia rosea]|uniref:Uncharacterized protein n=1 Tax=Yoonia rosea TaxID=287098 RepID=A0A1R3WH21_9RHOB|nr:hypothetical protein SAMN05421665_0504 [Yoonia rosea]